MTSCWVGSWWWIKYSRPILLFIIALTHSTHSSKHMASLICVTLCDPIVATMCKSLQDMKITAVAAKQRECKKQTDFCVTPVWADDLWEVCSRHSNNLLLFVRLIYRIAYDSIFYWFTLKMPRIIFLLHVKIVLQYEEPLQPRNGIATYSCLVT